MTVRLSDEGVARKKLRGITARSSYLVQAKYLGDATCTRSADHVRLSVG